jgi:hypothetical protein
MKKTQIVCYSTEIRRHALSVIKFQKRKFCFRLNEELWHSSLHIYPWCFKANIHKLIWDMWPHILHGGMWSLCDHPSLCSELRRTFFCNNVFERCKYRIVYVSEINAWMCSAVSSSHFTLKKVLFILSISYTNSQHYETACWNVALKY